MDAPTGPLWSQQQAIAYEVALEAINDVIAGYRHHLKVCAPDNDFTDISRTLVMLRA